MSKAVDDMRSWFAKLSQDDQKDVVTFLYGGKALLIKGLYVGPRPELVTTRGLFVGPVPTATAGTCPTCGKPF